MLIQQLWYLTVNILIGLFKNRNELLSQINQDTFCVKFNFRFTVHIFYAKSHISSFWGYNTWENIHSVLLGCYKMCHRSFALSKFSWPCTFFLFCVLSIMEHKNKTKNSKHCVYYSSLRNNCSVFLIQRMDPINLLTSWNMLWWDVIEDPFSTYKLSSLR